MEREMKPKESMLSVELAQTFGDALHGVLVRSIEDDRTPGLLTLQFPTGVGKSYAVEHTIATLASRHRDTSSPILFVTPQIKNIPSVSKITELCQKEGYEPAPHDIMRLRSVSEMLSKTVHDGMLETIPRDHRAKTNVEEVIDTVRYLKGSKGYKDAIQRVLPEFKRSVRSLFPCAELEERIALLEHDEKWRWLAELWPSVFTRKARALLMTSSKFFFPHDTLLEAPCPIDEADWIRGSVVFMDEIDSTKKDCINAIITRSTHDRANLPGLVRSLWQGVDVSKLPESMFDGEDSERNARRIDQLRHVLDETARKTNVDYVYKADDEAIGTSELFMYDGTRRGTSIGATYFVRTDKTRKENVIIRKPVAGDGSRRLASDISELRGAITYSQSVIASMLRERHGYGLSGMDEEAVKNEILSTLETLGVKDRGGQMLMLAGIREILKGGSRNRGSIQEGQTLYEQGFGLVAIEESEAHKFSTHIYAYAMDDTPEKRMRSLIERSLVIGLSATAHIDSPLCNYDLNWLAGQRPSLIRSLSNADVELLEEAYQRHIEGYDRVKLKVVDITTSDVGDDCLFREASLLVKNPMLQDRVTNILSGSCHSDNGNSDTYVALRYVRVAKAYRYFLENVPEGVFICATTPSPKREASAGYRIDTLEDLFQMVRRDLGVPDDDCSVRFVAGSDDFQTRYNDMVSSLGVDCPRMFICASYGSLATGVNLQYDGKAMQTVSVSEFSFDSRVDLVGVYLDRITNIAPTRHRIGEGTCAKDTLTCAFELREMTWHGDLSIDEMDRAARALMGSPSWNVVKLVDKPSVKAACTRTVSQMVGRMCRTSNKAPTIHVLFDKHLSNTIDPYAMGDSLIGVETGALLVKIASMAECEPEPGGTVERILASRAMTTAGWLSGLSRRSFWSREDICYWEKMRLWCLGNPCPTSDVLEGSDMGWLYLDIGQKVESYRYWARGDFEDVGVSFDPTEDEDYPLEVGERAARLDVLARVPEVRRLFERQGWPLRWEASKLLMNPALFRNVYLGAIGEQVGKAVLESRIRGLRLAQIEDPLKYEKFDYVVAGTDVYVDFKHWRLPDASGGRYVDWIREKMRRVGATHALIVNMVCDDELRGMRCEEIFGGVLSVPYLIDDSSACVSESHVAVVRSWLRKAGALQ